MQDLDRVLKASDHHRAIVLVYLGGPCVVRWRQRGVRQAVEARSVEVAVRRAAAQVARQATT